MQYILSYILSIHNIINGDILTSVPSLWNCVFTAFSPPFHHGIGTYAGALKEASERIILILKLRTFAPISNKFYLHLFFVLFCFLLLFVILQRVSISFYFYSLNAVREAYRVSRSIPRSFSFLSASGMRPFWPVFCKTTLVFSDFSVRFNKYTKNCVCVCEYMFLAGWLNVTTKMYCHMLPPKNESVRHGTFTNSHELSCLQAEMQ